MEHIVQFAIGIDDNAIVKRIEENAEKTITDELKKSVMSIIFETNRYTGKLSNMASDWTERRVENFLEDHKAEIIECAGKYLAEKLARTKAAKEIVEDMKNEA